MEDVQFRHEHRKIPIDPVGVRGIRGLSMEEEAEAYEPLLARWLADGRPFDLVLGQFLRIGPAQGPATAPVPCAPDRFDCGSCRENPNLLPDGTLLACPGYVDSPLQCVMPNLVREDLSTVWAASNLRTLAEMRKKDVLSRNETCSACDDLGRHLLAAAQSLDAAGESRHGASWDDRNVDRGAPSRRPETGGSRAFAFCGAAPCAIAPTSGRNPSARQSAQPTKERNKPNQIREADGSNPW